jgi:molybdenum cofactor biosynthesis protein MoaC
VYFPDVVLQLINGEDIDGEEGYNARRKGSVLQTAQLAGIMGAKRTSELIPLCHGLNLSHVNVELQVHYSDEGMTDNLLHHYILIKCTAKTTSQTGVEIEALTGASIAALTVWDMLKSVGGQQMRIEGILVTSKEGGKSGSWTRQS